MSKNKFPIVDTYKVDNGVGKCWFGDEWWYEKTLWEYTKDLPIFEIPLAAIPLGYVPWDMNNIEDFTYHMWRVNKADLKYPIILSSLGGLMDGHHRLVKALLKEKQTIKAVRIIEMPYRDGIKEE